MQLDFQLHYLIIPICSALIGWGTNYLAVLMLFHPRQEIRFFGIRVQGLVPKRQAELARKIAETIESDLLSHDDIERALSAPQVLQALSNTIRDRVSDFHNQLSSENPLLSLIVGGGEKLLGIKQQLLEYLDRSLPETLQHIGTELKTHLNFREIIEKRVLDFELGKLENVIYSISARELKAIEYWGGVLGFIIGMLQVAVMATIL